MENNRVLKEIQEAFNLKDLTMVLIYKKADETITKEDALDVLKDPSEDGFVRLNDEGLSLFLDGFIIYKRGEIQHRGVEGALTNNKIVKKLRVACNYKDEDMIQAFKRGGKDLKKSELSAFFRREDHKNYKELRDKYLLFFLRGIKE